MTFTADPSSIIGAAIVIGGSLIYLAREVSALAEVVKGLEHSVDHERDERKEADAQEREARQREVARLDGRIDALE